MDERPLASLANSLADRYRIERELGAGGMATVYLAQDLKHDRKVAIKVLKPELAAVLGAERFVVEIKTTAGLQHPHILPLFDSGTADGFLYYVMPYIEGETIREKLNRETQFGVDEAVRVAREVADALDYAHRRGVIHRDIKPENVLLHDGRAMVMDFGIALAVSAAAGGRMTETGISLGTPHYMSPEQATADKEITPRSDIYSLGTVLYEMLAGEPPHVGGSAQSVIMKIITEDARPVDQLRRSVPANVSAAISKAVERVPADRFETAKAFGDALANPTFTTVTRSTRPAPRSDGVARPTLALVTGGCLALAGLAVGVWGWHRVGPGDASPVVPLTLELPGARPDLARFAVSEDGSRFAFATDEGIAVRDSGKREYRLLQGTESGESPSFSPDGAWLVFELRGHLRKVPLSGGTAVGIVANDSLLGSHVRWGQEGSIVFESGSKLYLVNPAGTLRRLAKVERAQTPRLMPDGSGVLYIDTRSGSKLMYYDLAADTAFTVLDDSGEAAYLTTGHLVYAASDGGLFALAFDPKRHAVSGNPMPIVPDIQPNGGLSPFEISRNGTLVYRAGIDAQYRVLVREPGGRVDTLPLAPKTLGYVRVSPDGRTLAITVGSARGTNRYTELYDLALGGVTRFSQEGGAHSPVWSPDGKRLAFTADISGGDAEDIFVQPVDRSTPPVRLFKMPSDQHASSWPTDTMLVFSSQTAPVNLGNRGSTGGTPGAVYVSNPETLGAAPRIYVKAEWSQHDAVISPDAKWAAFTSEESGTPEILIRPFPVADLGGVVKVSSGGGEFARWSGDGRTIYYHGLDRRTIRAVHLIIGQTVSVGTTETVMTVPGLGNAWDVDWKTGKIYQTQAVGGDAARIVVMQHWLDDFRRGLATRR